LATQGTNTPQNRTSWLVIFASMLVSLGVYCILAVILQQSGSQPPVTAGAEVLRQVVYAAAVLVLLASILFWNVRTRAVTVTPGYGAQTRPHLPSASQFQTSTIVTLALAEGAGVLGLLLFFMGAGLNDVFALAGAGAAVMLALVLPRGLRYWSLVETREHEDMEGGGR